MLVFCQDAKVFQKPVVKITETGVHVKKGNNSVGRLRSSTPKYQIMKKILFAITICLLTFQTAHAEFKTGNGLVTLWREYERCSAGQPFNPNDDGFYTGYVAGVCDANMLIRFNIPEGVTIGQVCDITGKWLDKHPEKWNKPAHQLVIQAVKESFPMPKSKSAPKKK